MLILGCKELWERNYLAKENVIAMIGSYHFWVCTSKFEIPLVFKEGESQKKKKCFDNVEENKEWEIVEPKWTK